VTHPRVDGNVIQIAGVIDQDEVDLLLECGVRWLGFPLRLPVHREDLTEAAAARIVRRLAPPAVAVLITYLDRAADIVRFCTRLGTDVVQLHGEIAIEELALLREWEPRLTVIKSLVVGLHTPDELARSVRTLSPFADAFITDTFDPETGASGATGKTHDWAISRRLVEVSERPVILAGGLTPENVREAILAVRPAGVDAHTGVEGPDGRKEEDKVRRFVAEATAGFSAIEAG
jgi:phosphoribosylanthranilate isomerase